MELTQEYLLQNLNYDPETGVVKWRISGKGRQMGIALGSEKGNGYLTIRLLGIQYLLHRVIWLYCEGSWPKGVIDHKDTDKKNNRRLNLRDVEQTVNNQNLRKAQENSRTGVLGVRQCKSKFHANIGVAGKSKYVGSYDTVEEASAAYQAAKEKYHSEAVNGH